MTPGEIGYIVEFDFVTIYPVVASNRYLLKGDPARYFSKAMRSISLHIG
jgi:hypothetical protein